MWEVVAWGHRWGVRDLMGNSGHFWDLRGQGGSVCLRDQGCRCVSLSSVTMHPE